MPRFSSSPDQNRATRKSKSAGDEQFPVASLWIEKSKRAVVMEFYRLARQGDDIADDVTLSSDEKLLKINGLESDLLAGNYPDIHPYSPHLQSLFQAFRQDAMGQEIKSIDDLVAYCRLSAEPVGRFLLDLYGEDEKARIPSDYLCRALQMLNHLNDVRADWLELKRCYIPADWLKQTGLTPDDMGVMAMTPRHEQVFARYLAVINSDLTKAAILPKEIKSLRLKLQALATIGIARKHAEILTHGDPLRGLKFSKLQMALAALSGILIFWRINRGRA